MTVGTLPYSEFRILEVGAGLAEAFCGKLFADYGADVIKIEDPGRAGTRSLPPFFSTFDGTISGMHVLLDAGKRSIAVERGTASGRAVLAELAASADAVIDASRNVGEEQEWRELSGNDDLVVIRITPFGLTGPWSNWQGSDLVYQAVTATMYGWGREDGAPLRTPGNAAEFLTGASAAMLLASILRQPSAEHRGQTVDVSQASTQLLVAVLDVVRCSYIGAIPHRVSVPFPGIVKCADGYVGINLLTDSNWRDFCRMMNTEQLVADARFANPGKRLQHTKELNEIFGPVIAHWKKKELFELGSTQYQIPISMVLEPGELPNGEHYAARSSFVTRELSGGGTVTVSGEYLRMEGCPITPGGAPPRLGQHSFELMREIGRSGDEIAELLREGVLSCS